MRDKNGHFVKGHKENVGKKNRLGIKCTEKAKELIRIARAKQIIPREAYEKRILPTGELHHNWKGNQVKYRALHEWIESRLGKPKKCEHCKKDGLTGHQIHWANVSHFYYRDEDDWIRLCAKCHKMYDKLNN